MLLPADYCRQNKSQEADIDVGTLYGRGRFKNVYKGSYSSGPRGGTECVCKFIRKTNSKNLEQSFFDSELLVVKEALRLVEHFNQADLINERISVNQPEIWRPEGQVSLEVTRGKLCLVEPMIPNFVKFNSNTGWSLFWNQEHDNFWVDAMQSLSHFTYHCSKGTALLCDLQGGATDEGFTLTDPVIMSPTAGAFGPSDLGTPGISTFFARHKCTMFCNADWLLPVEMKAYFPCWKGSSMEVPGQSSINRWRTQQPRRRFYQPSFDRPQFVPAPPQSQGPPSHSVANSGGMRSQASSSGFHYSQRQWGNPFAVLDSQWSAGDSSSMESFPSFGTSMGAVFESQLPPGMASQADTEESSEGWVEVVRPRRMIKVRLAPYTAP